MGIQHSCSGCIIRSGKEDLSEGYQYFGSICFSDFLVAPCCVCCRDWSFSCSCEQAPSRDSVIFRLALSLYQLIPKALTHIAHFQHFQRASTKYPTYSHFQSLCDCNAVSLAVQDMHYLTGKPMEVSMSPLNMLLTS